LHAPNRDVRTCVFDPRGENVDKYEFRNGSLLEVANEQFADVEPGFFELSSTPVLAITPVVVPVAVVAVQGSLTTAAC
jgi:hypothetical protein